MYEVYSKIYQAKSINIKYINKKNQIFFDFEQLIQSIKNNKIKLVCLPNPDSPSGTIVSKNKIEIILKEAKKKNTIILINKKYLQYNNL